MTENIKIKQLPLFEEKYALPTGKQHLSYSEISTWLDCSFKHKLKYVDKIELDKPSIHTEFGHVIHGVMAKWILGEIKEINLEVVSLAQDEFLTTCDKLKTEYGVEIEHKDRMEFHDAIPSLLKSIPDWFNKQFLEWKPVAAEYELFEPIKKQEGKYFKGFIDTVIKLPAKKKKKNPEENKEIHYILDWKTCGFGWRPEQKRDFQKHLQLVLYKHYYCSLMDVDPKQVRCGFVLLKRQPRKSDNSHCELVVVSVGPKTEERGMRILNDAVNQINSGRVLKNRSSCRWCEYSGTRHCP